MNSIRSKIIYLGIFMGTLVFCGYLLSQQKSEEITITGTVDAVEFDENDNVSQVAISVEHRISEDDFEFINYYVVNDKKGLELFRVTGRTVKATGKLTVDKKGDKFIQVSSYILITLEESSDFGTYEEEI